VPPPPRTSPARAEQGLNKAHKCTENIADTMRQKNWQQMVAWR